VAVEREQELPDHDEDVEEKGELISLVQQPEAVEEAAGVARLFGSRGVGESAQGGRQGSSFVLLFSTEAGTEAVRRGSAGGGEAAQVAGEGGRAAGAEQQRERKAAQAAYDQEAEGEMGRV
jgi:hypothetical protein